MSRPLFGRNPSRRPKSVRPLLEALEDRCVPSTTATTPGNGILTITTNSAAAAITVAETASPGGYIVSATGLSGGSVSFSRITSIVVQATGGNDTLTFVGDNDGAGPEPIPSTILSGGLSVTSTGTLSVNVGPYFNIGGNSTFTDTANHGSLNVTVSGAGATIGNATVTGGAGNDSFTLADAASVTGNLTTNLGSGTNLVSLGTGSGAAVTVTGNVNISGGGGTDDVTFLKANVNGNVSATGGGNEVFTIGASGGQPVHIAGYLSINDTSAKKVTANIQDTSVGSYLAILSGAGNDVVNVGSSTVGANFGLQLGSGNDVATLTGDSIGGNLFTTGSDTGKETFRVNGVSVSGGASFNDPSAAQLTVGINNSSFNSYLAIIGGGGNDAATVSGGTTVAQNLAIELGNGNNAIGIGNTVVTGNTTLKTGSGNDVVTIENGTFHGATAIGTGGGADRVNVQIGSGTQTQFFGPTTIATGVGNSVVNLGSPGSGGVAAFYDAGGPDSNGAPNQVFFEGGGTTSHDTLNQIDVNYFGGTPSITGFRNVTG